MPRAKAAAQKALEIDKSLAEAHTSLAEIYKEYDWDWAACETRVQARHRAQSELRHGAPVVRRIPCGYERHAEAIAEAQRAEQLDPLSPVIRVGEAAYGGYLYARRYDEAIRRLRETVSLFPEFEVAYRELGNACVANGMDQDAFPSLSEGAIAFGASAAELAAVEQAYAKGGMRGYFLWGG